MANPKTTTYIEPNYYSRAVTDWNPSSIKSAISVMSSGYYSSAAMLADSILADDRVKAALGTRIMALLGLPLSFEPADEKNQKAVKASEDIKKVFWDIAPESEIYRMLAYGWILGVALVKLNWERKEGQWIPKFHVWHPSNLRYDTIKRRWLVKVDTAGREIPFEANSQEWFLFTPFGENHPWTNALIRSLSVPFLMKCYAVGDWARNSEVHGGAIKAVTVPSSTTDDPLKKIVADVQALGADGVIGLREGQKLELLEVTENVWQGFQGLIAWADKAIATSILGQNMTTEPTKDQVGVSGAKDVRQDVLESDVEVLETAFHQNALTWWALFNYGDGSLAPYPYWNARPQIKGKIEEFHIRAKAVKRNEIREGLGLPPLSKEEGGEEFVEVSPSPQPSPNPGEGAQGLAARLPLASKKDPIIEGQKYVDNLVDNAAKRAAELLKQDVANIMGIIEEATDPEDLRQKLLDYYEGMSPLELTELTTRAMVMAKLAGMYSEVAS